MSSIKGQIRKRSIGIFAVIATIGVIIIWGIIRLQQNDKLVNASVEESLIFQDEIEAMRGNIYAADGKSLLATSVPYYNLELDAKQAKPELFKNSVDSLSLLLSRFFKDKSKQEYKALINGKRNATKGRSVRLVSRRITHQEKEIIEKFPLFREGRYKGGGIFTPVATRSLPFNTMAMKTIGSLDPQTKTKGLFGIERAFDKDLAGKNGSVLVKRLAGGVKLPLESNENSEAIAGHDVVTTLDVNFQDIVETALKNKLAETNAKYGSAIVMEISTGKIKAISNFSRRARNGRYEYFEDMNHAVLSATDPGSTFKLASMMAVLEKGNLKLTDYAANCRGSLRHYGTNFTCDHHHGDITVQEVFEKSCNIGVYKLIERVFGMNGLDEYLKYIHQYGLDQPVGFQLLGERKPFFRDSKDKNFSKTTLPWMSIGYEARISPLQMVTFYNAVANNGYWVEPYLVQEVKEGNQVIEVYHNRKKDRRISDKSVIDQVKVMMNGVVERGTAASIKDGFCKVAGKTGTAQKLGGEGYSKAGKFYTSFIGYFPADNPKYTCTIVIDDPQGSSMYASKVCAPVFRDIANKIFAYDVQIHPAQKKKQNIMLVSNQQKVGMASDLQEIASVLGLPTEPEGDGLVKAAVIENGSMVWQSIKETTELPNVAGMTLRDALPLLENKGYKVKHSGLGKVTNYSLSERGTVHLHLD